MLWLDKRRMELLSPMIPAKLPLHPPTPSMSDRLLLGNSLRCDGASGVVTRLPVSQALPHQADMMLQRVEHIHVPGRHTQVIGARFEPL